MKYFFNISDLSLNEILSILDIETDLENNFLEKKNIGLLFEKPSTRTRLSFSVGISNLKGIPVDLRYDELNFSRDESFEDTFKMFDLYLDGLIFRTNDHNKLLNAKEFFSKPIINGLSDISHPCQILSDLFTLRQHFKTFNLKILWMGDMNNVCFSLLEAANLIEDLSLIICTPSSISIKKDWVMKSNISLVNNLDNIELQNIKCVMTDVFVSMNDQDSEEKIRILKPFQVTAELMSKTSQDSVFMHCLPAKVGLEVSKDVFHSSKSIVWKQAYNRMIVQKKLLQFIYQ